MLDKRQLFSTESLLLLLKSVSKRRKWDREGKKWGDTER